MFQNPERDSHDHQRAHKKRGRQLDLLEVVNGDEKPVGGHRQQHRSCSLDREKTVWMLFRIYF